METPREAQEQRLEADLRAWSAAIEAFALRIDPKDPTPWGALDELRRIEAEARAELQRLRAAPRDRWRAVAAEAGHAIRRLAGMLQAEAAARGAADARPLPR
jgi:hypothetical protein